MHMRFVRQPELPDFDPEPLRRGTFFGRLLSSLFVHPITMFALRRLGPTPFLFNVRIISRYDDAREALRRPDVFGVPWEAKMQMQAATRQPFILSTDDPAAYACAERRIMKVFRYDDGPRIAAIAADVAQRIVDGAAAELDVVRDLIMQVPVHFYRTYYGIEAPAHLALWLMAISNYTFRRIGADDEAKAAALADMARVGVLVDEAIRRAKEGCLADTIASRLVRLQQEAPGRFPDAALRSTFIGMVAGYDPVATSAAGNILEVLLDRPNALAATRQAARDDDDDLLTRCLLEALRFQPINPGLWRICRRDFTLAAGTSRATQIRQGEKVLVFLQSAMQDEAQLRHPWRFDPGRPASDSMVFGYGTHWCVGAPLALAQLVPMLKPLLVRGFRRAPGPRGRTRRFGAFPESLTLRLGQG